MHRRLAVAHVVGLEMCGVRRASRVFGVARSTCYRKAERSVEHERSEKLVLELSERHPTLGARKVAALAQQQHGERINHKRVARLRRQHGLRASRRGRKRRRLTRSGEPCHRAQRRDEVWSYDFITDALADGRPVRLLSIVDEYSRECLLLEAARSFPATRVIDCLERLLVTTGRCPRHLRSDNGPEFIAKEVRQWLEQAGVKAQYIDPGAPWQNGHVESFHASLRAELLDRELFFNLQEVQSQAEDWRLYYNYNRPHGALGYQPPVRHQKEAPLRPCATLQASTAPPSGQKNRSPLTTKPAAN